MTISQLCAVTQSVAASYVARALAAAVASGDVDAIVLASCARVSGFSADALRNAAREEAADERTLTRAAVAEATAQRVRQCERRANRRAARYVVAEVA